MLSAEDKAIFFSNLKSSLDKACETKVTEEISSDSSKKKKKTRGNRYGKVVKVGDRTFRSQFEATVFQSVEGSDSKDVTISYESEKVPYIIPATEHKYIPDIILTSASGKKIYLEIKGMLTSEMRKKYVAIRDSNPGIDLRFIFQNPAIKVSGNMTAAKWCDKEGFLWAHGRCPKEWLEDAKD